MDRYFGGHQHVGFLPAPTDRVDMRMLDEKQSVADAVLLPELKQFLLECQGDEIVHAAQISIVEFSHGVVHFYRPGLDLSSFKVVTASRLKRKADSKGVDVQSHRYVGRHGRTKHS
jgi:hypothetical protein